eukprot:CAMPEP_0201675540 /NCGR_PEP_ID=MMETSP0494-20130426/39794_1 /ASSEMBLY_ACC=CAM_ASM_000839 /TAXON_ID=420259 /ORGANISM="Thalassiosira gravida, Strain GMp14c1" /LENGTH=86 /DNA_ID=CAMNT_0048158017 /DNA_START=4 /DNA_END=264 /DNA_ORIENTATION=+
MTLKHNAQQHGKNLPRGRHRTTNQRIEPRHGIKDERLTHRTAHGEFPNERKHFGVVRAITHSFGEFAKGEGDENGEDHHEEVGEGH